MVFFTCNACGESLKKAQVEKHVIVCRNCQCLSCIDCGKDFWGDDYKNHVKCISEDQKYGGKGYEAKANKGDVKQQQWIQRIHEMMKKPSISPNVRNILNQIGAYDNIPRKKAKFQNWMKNSLKIHNQQLQDQVWEIFSEAISNPNSKEPSSQQGKLSEEVGDQPRESEPAPGEADGVSKEGNAKKKNKRERKEERQKAKKKEKKVLKLESQQEDLGKKGKKRERKDSIEDEERAPAAAIAVEKKKKKQQRGKESAECSQMNGDGHHVETAEERKIKASINKRKRNHSEGEPYFNPKKLNSTPNFPAEDTEESVSTIKVVGKFNWRGTIKAVLKQAPDNEISIKKLRKKVLAQYYLMAGDKLYKSEEDLLATFNKKVRNNPKFKVLKEKVKLLV
ncbi:cell growth-regulating nucleolar protein [Rhinatrema bivittatum]|uniref:cell growth-regulating nucleolar protein n=1 Tax=Rhinatrema bivittatum TaxID=194408 RepID=UPI00112BAD00|nr:cell growth-regulating nucleolar protein [Rhinatrema bivittatum]XP_029446891.1 cell growth-regulating nucleolar protein [Rhinatrema bivittatum]XP_029446900.1 cell growth-regulating nucleolar protein [Rhinatrema bivittatum]XP_029446911.1 cell growth-regulating nucleolar protein [Rhinatrema bivittatum]XP_029446920.1 cell growth-regulating nucleolar protein [Rhinatrema bivittatum]XP_029446930.1 cell growth-regulating nucleolar protein [Rhinatrema bivittatum]